jgi:hypothetical protein
LKNQKVILKFDVACQSDEYLLRRVVGTVQPGSMIKLLDIADLEANPREAKVGTVTEGIIESLEAEDRLFHFKSKGLLIAAGECRTLDRMRYQLEFSDADFEGILDGGHNLLAIAIHVLQSAIGEDHPDIKKIKRWEDVKAIWTVHRDEIEAVASKLKFLVPVEIVYPQTGIEGQDVYEGAILAIAQARNNNAELTEETKANKAGYYEELKESLDANLCEQVEWKTNDGGRIKARDLVALSWIPLSRLGKEFPDIKQFNPVNIYSSKGTCTKAFNELVKSDDVSEKTKGDVREITHPGIQSAIALMKDIPALYDLIYEKFPEAYNNVSPGFGRIEGVRIYDAEKAGDGKHVGKPPLTKFYRNEVKYDYPDGYIMPLVFGLSALIDVKGNKLTWKTDPFDFIEENLDEILETYVSTIQMAQYDPQTVGKSHGSYNLAVKAVGFLLK